MLRLTVSQSVRLGVEPILGLMTKLSSLGLESLSLSDVLSDKRSGLSFAVSL
jgi:hypothetical protein